MPLSERVRVEVYLPDLRVAAYQNLLAVFEQEFTYAFGGCTIARGLDGSYLSRLGRSIRDRVNLIYTDAPFPIEARFQIIAEYADKLRNAAFEALEEEAVLVTVFPVYHSA